MVAPKHMLRRRIWLGLLASALVVCSLAGFFLYQLVTGALPQEEGEARLPGLSRPVEVYRDPAGIPHILAESEYDAYVAAGYVHAQDRLWQMDILRRYGQGRLAEVFGSRLLPADRLMRSIGIARLADSLLRFVSPQTRNILEAYARGVNAGIREARGRLPVEFDLLQYEPEPWQPAHSLIIARLMGWELGLSWWVDLTLQELITRFGEDKARQIFPRDDSEGPFLPPAAPGALPGDAELLRAGMASLASVFGNAGSGVGSNSWVIDGRRSASGKPILANDPHLVFMQPARWYIMHMSTPRLNVAGVTLPGVPGVVIGHNGHIAWGLTNLMADDVDFVVEDVSEKDSTWLDAGQRKRLVVHTDSIFIRDSIPVVHTTLVTRRGPVISPVYPFKGVIRDSGRFAPPTAVALRWMGYERSDDVLAIYRLNHARDWLAVREAIRGFGVPAQYLVYADASGTIGGSAMGRIPQRVSGTGMLPARGGDAAAEWRGAIPFEALPSVWQPEEGVIVAANARPPGNGTTYSSHLWEGDTRARRIAQLLGEQRSYNVEDMKMLQMDSYSAYVDTLRNAFVRALRGWSTRPLLMTRVMNRLAAWDCRMYASSIEASLYSVAYVHLLRNTFGDEMDSTLFANYTFLTNIPTRVMPRLLNDTTAQWFDDVRTPGIEQPRHILIRSIVEAVRELRRTLGTDMERWTWGSLHTVEFRHPLGEVTPLHTLFNVGPYPISGNNTTIQNSGFPFTAPYGATVGASMRFICDMASPDSSYIVLTTGQSGQPFSRHYADHTALWQTGALHRLVIDVTAIRRSSWKRLILVP